MDEKNYLIEFDYGGTTYAINNLSHNDLSQDSLGVKLWMAETIEAFIRDSNLNKGGVKVSAACLFGKGRKLITKITDFEKELSM